MVIAHETGLVDLFGHCKSFWLLTIETLRGFDPKVQLQSLVNPIKSVVVPFKAFDVTPIQVAKTEAPTAMVIHQSQLSIRNSLVLGVFLSFVPVTGLDHLKDLAVQRHRHASLRHPSSGPSDTCAKWPHQASPLFCEDLVLDLDLQPLLGIHFL